MNNARYFYYLSLLDHSYSLISPTTPIYFTDYICYIYIYILHSNYPTFTNTHIHLPLQNTLPTIYYKLTTPTLILHFIYTLLATIYPYHISLLPLLSFTLITITKAYTQLSLTYSQLYKYTTTHIFILAYSNTYSYYISILLFVLFIIFRYTNIIHLHTTLK